MQKRFFYLISILSFTSLAQAQDLLVETDKPTFLIGEPIYVSFTIKNTTSSRIWADGFETIYGGFSWEIEGILQGKKSVIQQQRISMTIDYIGNPPRYPVEPGDSQVFIMNVMNFSTAETFPSREDSIWLFQNYGKSFERPNFQQYLPIGSYVIKVSFRLSDENRKIGKEIFGTARFDVRAPRIGREKDAYQKFLYAYSTLHSPKLFSDGAKASHDFFEEISKKYGDTPYSITSDYYLRQIRSYELKFSEMRNSDMEYIKKYPNALSSIEMMSTFSEEDILLLLKDIQGTKVAKHGTWLMQYRPKRRKEMEIQQKEDEEKIMRWKKIEEKSKQKK